MRDQRIEHVGRAVRQDAGLRRVLLHQRVGDVGKGGELQVLAHQLAFVILLQGKAERFARVAQRLARHGGERARSGPSGCAARSPRAAWCARAATPARPCRASSSRSASSPKRVPQRAVCVVEQDVDRHVPDVKLPRRMVNRYDELYRSFRWEVPARYNIAHACCGQWAADRNRVRPVLGGRVGRDGGVLLLGHPGRRQPPVERAGGARREARRPRRAPAAAAPRDGDRLHRHLPDGRDRAAAFPPVRPRCARVPPGARRRERRHRGIDHAAQPAVDPQPSFQLEARDRRGGEGGRGTRLEIPAGEGEQQLQAGRYLRRRPRADRLHQRHHRPAQGRAEGASRDARQHAGVRALARLPAAEGRHVLVAGRLGVDRRADGRAAAGVAARHADPRLPRPLRRGEGLLPAGEVRHPQLFPVSDRPEADDEGGPQPEAEVPAQPEVDHERRRIGRRDGDRVGARAARRDRSTRCSARPRSTTWSATARRPGR